MDFELKIKRINELYHKSQREGLTDEENRSRRSSEQSMWQMSGQI